MYAADVTVKVQNSPTLELRTFFVFVSGRRGRLGVGHPTAWAPRGGPPIIFSGIHIYLFIHCESKRLR